MVSVWLAGKSDLNLFGSGVARGSVDDVGGASASLRRAAWLVGSDSLSADLLPASGAKVSKVSQTSDLPGCIQSLVSATLSAALALPANVRIRSNLFGTVGHAVGCLQTPTIIDLPSGN